MREIGGQLGVDATGLYRIANRLTADGRIRKDGTGLHPIESAPAPDASAAGVTATVTAAEASDAAVAAQRSGSTDGNAAAKAGDATAAPEADVTEATAESAPGQE